MARVVVTPAARADLVAIRKYSIEQFGADVADAYFLGFDQAFDRLADHPQIGVAMDDLRKNIRCLVHRRYRILYQTEENTVTIARIVHHAMDARRALKGEAG